MVPDKVMLTEVAYPERFYPDWFLDMISDMSLEEQDIMNDKYLSIKQGGKHKIGELGK